MSFSEVCEFTGFESRKPTKQEIDIIATEVAFNVVQSGIRNGQIETSLAQEKLKEQIAISAKNIEPTCIVYDFREVNKRLIVFSSLLLGLSHPHEFPQVIMPGITTPQHNHLVVGLQVIMIDEENKIYPALYKQIDICLLNTQSKKEETN